MEAAASTERYEIFQYKVTPMAEGPEKAHSGSTSEAARTSAMAEKQPSRLIGQSCHPFANESNGCFSLHSRLVLPSRLGQNIQIILPMYSRV